MLGLDHNGVYVVSAFGITGLGLGGYLLYLRSRLSGLRRRLERAGGSARPPREMSAAVSRPGT